VTDYVDKAEIISSVCEQLLRGNTQEAKNLAQTNYPFQANSYINGKKIRRTNPKSIERGTAKRMSPSPETSLSIWLRDGFRCRYTGVRLIFPQSLELLSVLLPNEFPYDNPPHGSYIKTHIAMWELWPVIDHVNPVVSSSDSKSVNNIDNLVTTSAQKNIEKSDTNLKDLGWDLLPVEMLSNWDGLVIWFINYISYDRSPLSHLISGKRLSRWYDLLLEKKNKQSLTFQNRNR
jgi:hypothetical protein